MSNHDEFSAKTKSSVAARAGWQCSLAGCQKITIGPSDEAPDAVAKTGEAAHICAAAPGGRRYDASMIPEERSGIGNAIWLCADHAKLVDRDEVSYPASLLQAMKIEREKAAELEHRTGSGRVPIGGLLAIGPDIVCAGDISTISAASWELEPRHFLIGDMHGLVSFIGRFEHTSAENRYILSNELGDGRHLMLAPTLTRQGSGLTLICPIAPVAQRIDAQKLGSTLAIHPVTNDLYINDKGDIARVSGAEALPQIMQSMLSMQQGENVFHPKSGMRFFEYFKEFAGSAWLSELMKLDVIRQASIPKTDDILKTQYTPLRCITRVRNLELSSETPINQLLPIRLDVDVQGIGRSVFELSIYMPTREQMLVD